MMLSGVGLALFGLVIAGWIAFALRRAGLALALAGGIGVPVAAIAVYAALGTPGLPDRPLAARMASEPQVAEAMKQAEFRRMVASLAERLQGQPDDREGWTMLARSYRVLEEWALAASAWSRLIEIKGEGATAEDWAELADLRIAAAGGVVDARTLEVAERSLALNPTVAKSRHFVALGMAQRGDLRAAVQQWRALLADAPAGAPWREAVARQLADVTAMLAEREGRLPPASIRRPMATPSPAAEARPDQGPTAADVAAARQMSGEDRAAMIESMVQSLADRLADNPDDPAGWLRLGRAYGVLGRTGDANAALAKAEQGATAHLAGGTGDASQMRAVLAGVRALRGG